MKKTLVALAAIASIAAGSLAAAPARANDLGAAVAGGLIGGVVGGAIASSRPAPAYGGPVYVEEAPPPCRWVRERFWDGYGWRFRRVEVCN
jgi:hypothetical protein